MQVGFGAFGQVMSNTVTGNDWTAYASDTNPQPQADYGAGILLYAAGIDGTGAVSKNTSVTHNTLGDNQIGVEIVDSDASLQSNRITETTPGLADSIGIYGVGCDSYCGYFNANNGQSLTNTASTGQAVRLTGNSIDFAATPARSFAIWMGDNSWTGNSSFFGPAGCDVVHPSGIRVRNVGTKVVIGGGATTEAASIRTDDTPAAPRVGVRVAEPEPAQALA